MASIDNQFHKSHIPHEDWSVEVTDEFVAWWDSLTADEQESVAAHVGLLERLGPDLPFPYSSAIAGTKRVALRELRIRHRRRHVRVLYAFDPRRVALLLLGGDKTGRGDWYRTSVPRAERLFFDHLAALRREGWLNG